MPKTYDDETEQAPAGDIVIDPFLGSRSRLIGCEKTGRRCCGLELDPLYIDHLAPNWPRRQREAEQTRALASVLHNGAMFTVTRRASKKIGPSVLMNVTR